MRGCLEFIEYLRVGDCNPVEELGELSVGVPGRVQFEPQRAEFALNQAEVAASHRTELVQSAGVECVAAAIALFDWVRCCVEVHVHAPKIFLSASYNSRACTMDSAFSSSGTVPMTRTGLSGTGTGTGLGVTFATVF